MQTNDCLPEAYAERSTVAIFNFYFTGDGSDIDTRLNNLGMFFKLRVMNGGNLEMKVKGNLFLRLGGCL